MANPQINAERLKKLCKYSLSAFIQRAFQEVGNGEYHHNWHIDAMAEYLTACYKRDIKRLIINVPPRSLKSISTTIAFPAWALGHNPKLEIMTASYSQDLSEDHSVACRKVMRTDWYHDIFPDTILAPDQNQKSKFNTTVGGARRATSVGGTSVGKGGNILICFPYDEMVQTECGAMKIGDIVTNKLKIRVWSYNTNTGIKSLKSIINWKHNPGSEIIELSLNDGRKLKCTPNHKIWTSNRGFIEASHLMASDVFPSSSIFNTIYRSFVNIIIRCNSSITTDRVIDFYNLLLVKFCIGSIFSNFPIIGLSHFFSCRIPVVASPNLINSTNADFKFFSKLRGAFVTRCDKDGLIFGNDSPGSIFHQWEGSMFLRITNILNSSAISKIRNIIIYFVSIKMSNIASFRSFSNESKNNSMSNIENFGFSMFSKIYPQISVAIRLWFKNSFFNFVETKSIPEKSRFAANISIIRNTIKTFIVRNKTPFNIISCDHAEDTFCLTVEDNHTFYCGSGQGIVVTNCDDPLSPLQASSDTERKSALNFLQQSWMTRLNDKKQDVSIIVMQRLHEQDPAGFLLAQGGWEHLFLPAINDIKRTISIGNFTKEWGNGEYLDEERLGEKTLEQLKIDLGSNAFTGQYMQRPSPEGGGIIKEEWWKLWEGKEPPKTHDIIQVYDTAFTEKTTNDFCARTTWGIFEADDGEMNIILLERLNKRMEFPELLQAAKDGYIKYTKPKTGEHPLVLVEEKASGLPLIQELRKAGLRVKGIKRNANSGDKISRCHNITHIFENGRVWVPCNMHEVDGKKHYTPKPFAQEVIDQSSMFPNGAHDDLVDTVIDAVAYLRKWREIKTDYDKPEDVPYDSYTGKKKRYY